MLFTRSFNRIYTLIIDTHVDLQVKIINYKARTLPVVLTLRGAHRLRVCEIKLLGIIFAVKSDEVTGGCRKLLNEEISNL
jgi:hypothetical protein